MSNLLSPPDAKIIADYLEHQFPWLLTDDEWEVSGGDVVEQLVEIHEALRNVAPVQVTTDNTMCPQCGFRSTRKKPILCPKCGECRMVTLRKGKKK